MKRKIRIFTMLLSLCLAVCSLTALAACTKEEMPSENMTVTISDETIELEVGGSQKLTVKIEPTDAADKTVEWKSSDEKIATVKDGLVTAVAAGEAIVTVTSGGKSDSCKVIVKSQDSAGDTSSDTGSGSAPGGSDATGSDGTGSDSAGANS